jgi:hypothetical protein
MKKWIVLFMLSFIMVCSVPMVTFANTDVRHEREEVKIVIGQPSKVTDNLTDYINSRKNVLNDLGNSAQQIAMNALVVFNEFKSPEQVQKVVDNLDNNMITCKRIWVANPGQVGIGTALVLNNDIEHAYQAFLTSFQQYADRHIAEGMATDDLIINRQAVSTGKFEVYAVLISGSATTMSELYKEKSVLIVDPHNHSDLTLESNQEQARIKYIDIPLRPDGII